MSFLKAEWRKLILINYAVEPALLNAYIPYGTTLDLCKGKCYVSLVGFMFHNTKIRGIKIPFHTHFEEVNLRFYVERKHEKKVKRGVVFIKEIVPKIAIAAVANAFYKEHYRTLEMKHKCLASKNELFVEYGWRIEDHWNTMSVNADPASQQIPKFSDAEFFTEHYWGYTKVDDTQTMEYEVTHPRWQHYAVNRYELNLDFGLTYGKEFGFLDDLIPESVILAEGSAITVERKRELK